MNRRLFLLAGSALAAGCTVTKNGTVTTLTINVAKVAAYGQVFVNGVSMLLSIGAITSAIGPVAVPLIQASAAALKAALDQWNADTAGTATVSLDNSTFSAEFASILADAGSLLGVTKTAIGAVKGTGLVGSAMDTANTIVGAMETGLSLLQAMVVGNKVGAVAVPRMSEAQMFAVTGVTPPK